LSYRDLARHLSSDQPLYGLQSRGIDGMSRINTRIEDMARDYVAEIRKAHPCGPYAICGWSFGGTVAFEIARQLEQEGQVVALLALFDTHAPGRARQRGSRTGLRRHVSRVPVHVRTFLHGPGRVAYVGHKARTARQLVEAPLWRLLVLWQRRGGWLPRALQSVTQANKYALRDYGPQAYGGRVTLFKATQRRDPLMGWGPLATGGLEIHEVPGTHRTMVFEPHVRTLAEKLARCLDKAWAWAEASAGQPTGAGHGGDRAA
jgi:thioesterase domain-containing protein